MLTQSRLHECLDYDPTTGVFVWKIQIKQSGKKIGSIAGYKLSAGYVEIGLDGERYYAHRLAWFYVHGVWPPKGTDHRNGQRDDNSIENIRPATQWENAQNIKVPTDNTSGFIGAVHFRKDILKWTARIKAKKVYFHLGCYETAEAAAAAYRAAKIKLHAFQPVNRDEVVAWRQARDESR